MRRSEEPPYVAPPLVVPGRLRTLAYNAALPMLSETVDAEGHLIDSGDLQAILTTIVEQGASYEILNFDMGRTNAPRRGCRCACRPRPASRWITCWRR